MAYWHQLRAEHDAVMVGVGTVLADDPRLTVRHATGRDPLRVVVDSRLRTPLDAAVLAGEMARGTLLATTAAASSDAITAARATGATVVVLPTGGDGRVDLVALLAALAERGITTIMVEGGAQVITALLRLRLANRMVVCVAPKIMGAGTEAVGDLHVRTLNALLQLEDVQVLRFGVDIVFDGRIVYPSGDATIAIELDL